MSALDPAHAEAYMAAVKAELLATSDSGEIRWHCYVQHATPVAIVGGVLYLTVPADRYYTAPSLRARYAALLRRHTREAFGRDLAVEVLDPGQDPPVDPGSRDVAAQARSGAAGRRTGTTLDRGGSD